MEYPMVRLLVTFVAALWAANAWAGGPIVDTGGFESFNNMAPLAGQNGWASSGTGSATVQSTVVQSGARAVKVDKSAGSDSRWGREVTGYPTSRFILIDWDMNVTGTGATGFGPVFGVEAYDAHLPAPFKLLGSLFVDSTTGDVLYQDDDGFFAETGTTVPFDAWRSYRMLLDFTLAKYSVYVGGARLGTYNFVDNGTQFTDADISTLAAGFDSASQNRLGTAYFDNFIVRDGIPGDFDSDGDIDDADFAKWKTGFGTTTGGIADSDGDQDSDGADFLTWQRARGANLLAATPVAAAVPEPAAVAMAAVAALLIVARGRRRG